MGPRDKANLVNAMEKIMMLVSNPSREGTMECVACMRAAAQNQGVSHITDFRVLDKTFHTSFKPHINVLTIEACADNSAI